LESSDELELTRSVALSTNLRDGDIVVVHWPQEPERRSAAAEKGVARLLVIDRKAPPPAVWDVLEDWVRLPVDRDELESRRLRLMRIVKRRRPPVLEEHGLVRRGKAWVALSNVEEQLFRPLLENLDHVVRRADLGRAIGADLGDRRNTVDAAIRRLRLRIAPLGLTIRTVRPHGYALELDETPS